MTIALSVLAREPRQVNNSRTHAMVDSSLQVRDMLDGFIRNKKYLHSIHIDQHKMFPLQVCFKYEEE